MKNILLLLSIILFCTNVYGQKIKFYDAYIQTLNDPIDVLYFNQKHNEIISRSIIFSKNIIKEGIYSDDDKEFQKIQLTTKKSKFSYYFYSVYKYDTLNKSFILKNYILKKNPATQLEWKELQFLKIKEKNISYECSDKVFDNIIFTYSIGSGNEFIIQRNEKNNLSWKLIGLDCEIINFNNIKDNFKINIEEKFICIKNFNSYLFFYSDLE